MIYINIAQCVIGLNMPSNINFEEVLPNFKEFIIKSEQGIKENIICTINCLFETEPTHYESEVILAENNNAAGNWIITKSNGSIIIKLAYFSGFPSHVMISDDNYNSYSIYLKAEDPLKFLAVNSFIMFAYAQNSYKQNAILVHASAVREKEYGYAFLGKSGTGKSTHSRLWIESLNNIELLNDDNPIVKIEENGDIFIYGTPWSGKTDCYKNERAKLIGLIQLKQAKVNKLSQINNIIAYLIILKSSSTTKWDKKIFKLQGDIIEKIANNIPIYLLENLPQKEAAFMAYNCLNKRKKE